MEGHVNIRHITLWMSLATLLAVNGRSLAGEQAQMGLRAEARGPHDGGLGGLLQGGEGIMQEGVIGRIISNPKTVSELGLSDDQVKTLKNAAEDTRKQQDELQKQLKDAGLEQAKLMTGDSVDEKALLNAVDKAGKIKTDMAKLRIKHMLLVKKTLRPDQVGKIRDMIQKRVKQMGEEGGDRHILKGKGEGEILKDRREHLKKRLQDEKTDGKTEAAKPAGTGV